MLRERQQYHYTSLHVRSFITYRYISQSLLLITSPEMQHILKICLYKKYKFHITEFVFWEYTQFALVLNIYVNYFLY